MLSNTQRKALALHDAGYKAAEIAALLGTSENTIRVRICEAKRIRTAAAKPVKPSAPRAARLDALDLKAIEVWQKHEDRTYYSESRGYFSQYYGG